MNLTAEDLGEIRAIVESALAHQTSETIRPIQSEIQALRNDIKEIYDMLADLQGNPKSDQSFQKLSLERKLLRLNADLLKAAQQAGITLPR